jgi:hypothetical protein
MKFSKDKSAFESSAVIQQYKAVADMNDFYFELRKNGFFEFYRQLFDSVKNSSYPGKYSVNKDTLLLSFYNKKGEEILGRKALVNHAKKEIIFFDNYPGVKKRLIFN